MAVFLIYSGPFGLLCRIFLIAAVTAIIEATSAPAADGDPTSPTFSFSLTGNQFATSTPPQSAAPHTAEDKAALAEISI